MKNTLLELRKLRDELFNQKNYVLSNQIGNIIQLLISENHNQKMDEIKDNLDEKIEMINNLFKK
jgi:hypothetical protein